MQEKIPFFTFKFFKGSGKVEYVIWENKKFFAELFNISIKIGGENKISAKYPMKIVISDGRLTEISFKFRHKFDGSSAWGYPMVMDNLWEYKITYDYQETVAAPTEAQLAYSWIEKGK